MAYMNQLAFSQLRPRLHYAERFKNAALTDLHYTLLRDENGNLVSRVSHLTAPWGERRGGGKMRDPGNDVAKTEPCEDALQTREI